MKKRQHHPPISAASAGLLGRCPRCGRGKLFKSFLEIGEGCDACGLDYRFADAGDGPAVFIILILGFLVCGLALWTEVVFAPPYWVHLVLWLPITLLLAVGMLRPMKGLIVALQYKNKAREGRLAE